MKAAVMLGVLCACAVVAQNPQGWANRRQEGTKPEGRYKFPPAPTDCRTPRKLPEHVRCVGKLPDSLRTELWRKMCTLQRSIDFTHDSWDAQFYISRYGLVDSLQTTYTTSLDQEFLAELTRTVKGWTFYSKDIPENGVTVHMPLEFVNKRRRKRIAWIVAIGIALISAATRLLVVL